MGRCRRSTGAAALLPVGLGLTSREEPLVKNSLEATSRQGMDTTQKAPTATAVQWTVAEWRGHLGGATIRLHP